MSSSYSFFKIKIKSKERVSGKYTMESPQSEHLYAVCQSFLYYFVDLEFSIE